MSKRGSLIPKKLKHDAIIEALFEVRFTTLTQSEFLIVGLAGCDEWKGYTQTRLPAYGIPENLRLIDPNLRYQPTFELLEPSGQRSVRIGPNVMSYHVRKPYIGWSKFNAELNSMLVNLFNNAKNLVINRLGMRYLNGFSSKLHGINSIGDLDLSITIADDNVTSNVNLNFNNAVFAQTNAAIRIATPEFFAPQSQIEATVVADIDIFTRDGYETINRNVIFQWLEQARKAKNEEFFCLLTEETIKNLEDK